jgi:DNA processing protein
VDERQAWIVLASVDTIGDLSFSRLIAEFGSARDVLRRAATGELAGWSARLRTAEGRAPLNTTQLGNIEAAARDPTERLAAIHAHNLWTLTPLEADYPARLRDLDPPPALIHGLGDRAALHARRAVALVGTRRPTPAGRMLATRIAARLVECQAVVVSGLAVGIDGAAHAATVERGGVTVGVIGAGHASPGPRAHAHLRGQIVEHKGALISEHHPTTGATRGTFPRRNRIIAALAETVIVVEAPLRSGALITARHALELGRQLLVTPGRPEDWSVRGSLALLRETPARPFVGLDEMVEDLGYFAASAEARAPAAGRPPNRGGALALLGAAERAVAERLCRSPCGLDVLVADTGLAPGTVSSAVTLLLLRGWLTAMGPAYLAAGPLAE